MKLMFAEMVARKNADRIERFYTPDFRMYSNGVVQNYAAFETEHRKVYATDIEYSFEYDEEAWVEASDRVAGRVWITTVKPGEKPTRIEVILIATFLDGRIHRLWETTWPNWAELKEFKGYGAEAKLEF